LKHWALTILLALALSAGGCGKDKKKRRGASSSPASGGAAASSGSASRGTFIASVAGVPDLVDEAVDAKSAAKAEKHNKRGYKHYRKKRYEKAEAEYLKALTLNPRLIKGRYNLACLYALMGRHDDALGLLGQLKSLGCVYCMDRLTRVMADPDFKSMKSDSRLKALVKGIVFEEPDYEAASKAFRSKRLTMDDFEDTFEAGRALRVVYYNPDYKKTKYHDVYNKKSLRRMLKKWFPATFIGHKSRNKFPTELKSGQGKWRCKKKCCKEVRPECEVIHGGMTVSKLVEVCFHPETPEKAVPVKVKFYCCECDYDDPRDNSDRHH
jgi:hypothetical protein